MKTILAGLVTLALLSILALLLGPLGGSHGGAGAATAVATSHVALELAIDRYAALTKNMSQRIAVAEQALLKLSAQKLQGARRYSGGQEASGVLAGAAVAAEPQASGGSAASGGGAAASGGSTDGDAGDEPEETEEERKKRLEKEIEEQNVLIGFDEKTKQFKQRWRTDFRCGDRAPLLPDESSVECEPSGEAPCCSDNGWCGKSSQHCSCDTCADYSAKVKMKLDSFALLSEGHECEENAANLGEIKTPEECAPLVLLKTECSRTFMFSKNYPAWGCRCCLSGKGVSDEKKPDWSVYKLEASVVP